MASKRLPEDDIATPIQKKARKGFKLGPQNLPDGIYRRKLDKIRRRLVENAKTKKSYDKLKAREQREAVEASQNDVPSEAVTAVARHPERQALIDGETVDTQEADGEDPTQERTQTKYRHQRRPKPQPFLREQKEAAVKRQEVDKRQAERAAAEAEREKRIAERERWRRTMNNARGDGRRRKLGKESTVLLEKVKKMMRQQG